MTKPNPVDMTIGRTVKALLIRRERTQADLADKLGVSQQAVSDRLGGRTPWKVSELRVVARWLDTSVAALLEDLEPIAADAAEAVGA